MIQSYSLSEEDINYLLSLPEVTDAKKSVDLLSSNGHINFSIQIPLDLKEKIGNQMGINLTGMDTIPMRWIKGDTPAHSDRCIKAFDKTYLAYLTDSEGSLVVDGDAYAIAKGNAYVFSEGLMHETTGTGTQPRLLLGPMSEEGIYVGAGSNINGSGGTTIYVRQDGSGNYQYSTNNQVSWTTFVFPAFITNTNTSAGYLNIVFVNNITIYNSSDFFTCGSPYIQFGSTTLPVGGTPRSIYVFGVGSYPGFIQNGSSGSSGYGNINIFNLSVTDISGSTLAPDAGWLAQSYFGRAATGSGFSYIVNCSSNGNISQSNTGGIVGAYAYNASPQQLYIYGCSSTGQVSGSNAGGIVGAYAASTDASGNGSFVVCSYCWSEGIINGPDAGGIFGARAGGYNPFTGGSGQGAARAFYCYSTEDITGINAGGIFGRYAGNSLTQETDTYYSYSRGQVTGTGSGGIFGANAGNVIPVRIYNCYSSGGVALGNGGMVGSASSSNVNYTYIANGSWTDASANSLLDGVPPLGPTTNVGNVWAKSSAISNSPYELSPMGFSPYNLTNITTDASGSSISVNLRQTYNVSVTAGNITPSSVLTDASLNYQLIDISGGDPLSYGTILVNSSNGSVSTSPTTASGLYTLYVRNTGSYNITTINLNVVTPFSISAPGGTTIYIRDNSGNYQYSTDNQASWNTFVFPAQISNSTYGLGTYLNVEFTNDITINSSSSYFICGSPYIQFGSSTLPVGGARRKIYVQFVSNYPGLIQSGTSTSGGYGTINVFNLSIDASSSFIAQGGGWLMQSYFKTDSSGGNSYIVNCSTNGNIGNTNSGGIVGEYAYLNSFYTLYINGCSSTGQISGTGAGGIVGAYAGAKGTSTGGKIICRYCYSQGQIFGSGAGGIFGTYGGGYNGGDGYCFALNCYSTGVIGGYRAGGIFGSYAGTSSIVSSLIQTCYTRGDITGPESGGLAGSLAANNGKFSIYNSYASGSVTGTNANGIFGISPGINGTIDTNNIYTPNGSWNDSSANNTLQATPNYPTTAVGSVWAKPDGTPSTPYELYPMGFSPYNLTNITTDSSGSFLRQTYNTSVSAGSSTPASVLTNPSLGPFDYKILQISGGNPSSYGTFLISSANGVIITSTSTAPGTYKFYIRNTGSYNITELDLNVTGEPTPPTPISEICFPAGTPVLTDQGIVAIDKINTDVHTIKNQKIKGIVTTKLKDDYLICIEKNAIALNVPCEKTYMSGNHKVYYDGQMRKAKELLKHFNCIYKIKYNGETMYNVLMEKHETILVNNMVCETLDPTNNMAKIFYYLKNMSHEQQKVIVDKINHEVLAEMRESFLKSNSKSKKFNMQSSYQYIKK
jgi:hypothetical protein